MVYSIGMTNITKLTEQELWEQYNNDRSIDNRNALVVHYLPQLKLIAGCAYRKLKESVRFEEVFSAGCIGLIKAIEGYNSKRSKFTTYFNLRVNGEIIDWTRSIDCPRQLRHFDNSRKTVQNQLLGDYSGDCEYEIAKKMDLSFSRYWQLLRLLNHNHTVTLTKNMDVESNFEDAGKNVSLEWVLESLGKLLTYQEKVVLFGTHVHGKLDREVAKIFGCSESNISQLRRKAIKKIKKRFTLDGRVLSRVLKG